MNLRSFFALTSEKVYITVVFIGVRFLLGFLNSANVAAKLPFFVNMILAAIDLVVSLPMKLVFSTPFLKNLLRYDFGVSILFFSMIVYWYVFAGVLMHVYSQLNKKDTEQKVPEEQKSL